MCPAAPFGLRVRPPAVTVTGAGVYAGSRQATVSKLEAELATQPRILMDALAALDLELVIPPRTKMSAKAIEDLF